MSFLSTLERSLQQYKKKVIAHMVSAPVFFLKLVSKLKIHCTVGTKTCT